MTFKQQRLTIGKDIFTIAADAGYGKHLGKRFEPGTVALLEALCDNDSRILDIGANIGVTALAMSQIARAGRIVAVEPVPATFALLTQNLAAAARSNITAHQLALGNKDGEIVMQGDPNNLSGSYVADMNPHNAGHFAETVPLRRLDTAFAGFGLDRLDFIKMDVEGYELDVLEGASELLATHKPTVFMEMNYVVLNLWRHMSLPTFRTRLLALFPFVFAEDGGRYLDFRDEKQGHRILYEHLLGHHRHANIVAGFDRDNLCARLDRVAGIAKANETASDYLSRAIRTAAGTIESSTGLPIKKALRAVRSAIQ